jgi:thioredoxin reductase
VPNLEKRHVRSIEVAPRGFKVVLSDGEEFTSKRVVVATGIGVFTPQNAQQNARADRW